MLKLIQAGPLGGSPHSYVVSLDGLGFAGRSSIPRPSMSPQSTMPRPSSTATLAKCKYIPTSYVSRRRRARQMVGLTRLCVGGRPREHDRRAVDAGSQHLDARTEHRGDALAGEDILWLSGRYHTPPGEEHDPVAVARGEIQIV